MTSTKTINIFENSVCVLKFWTNVQVQRLHLIKKFCTCVLKRSTFTFRIYQKYLIQYVTSNIIETWGSNIGHFKLCYTMTKETPNTEMALDSTASRIYQFMYSFKGSEEQNRDIPSFFFENVFQNILTRISLFYFT